LLRAKTAEGGLRIVRSYLLVGHSKLKAHQKREFLSMRQGNNHLLMKV